MTRMGINWMCVGECTELAMKAAIWISGDHCVPPRAVIPQSRVLDLALFGSEVG